MKSLRLSLWLLVCLAANPIFAVAQDDIFDSSVPASKQAMLLVDIAVSDALSDPFIGPVFGVLDISNLGPPIELDDYKTIERLTVFVGNPDLRTGDSQFVSRIRFKDDTDVNAIVKKIFPIDADERTEDGWTVLDSGRRWPEIIRYKDRTFEFGTSLFTYSSSRAIASKELIAQFGRMDKVALARVVFDAKVLNGFVESLISQENLEADAVYQMFEWGNFINESSIAVYSATLLKEISTISLSIDPTSETLAKLSINAASGKESVVHSKAMVLYDFLKFHLQLPAKILKQKGGPLGDLLESTIEGMSISRIEGSSVVTLARPENLGKSIVKMMAGVQLGAKETQDRNTMMQVGLALHNYHDVYRKFPFAHPDVKEDARGINKDLSWRVKILPFCEWQNEYDRMDLSKGWDAEENQFVVAAAKKQFLLSRGSMVCGIIAARPSSQIRTILDGTSNTIMLIENPNAAMTAWSKPLDLKIDDAVKLVKGVKKGDFLWVTMFDGSVLRMPSMMDSGATEEQIRHLMDPRDGNVINTDILQEARRSLLPGLPGRRYRERVETAKDAADFGASIPTEAAEKLKEAVEKAADESKELID